MKVQVVGLFAVSLASFATIATGLAHHTAQQLWNPEIAQAAKITATLVKNKPSLLSRSLRPVSATAKPTVRYLLIPQAIPSSNL